MGLVIVEKLSTTAQFAKERKNKEIQAFRNKAYLNGRADLLLANANDT